MIEHDRRAGDGIGRFERSTVRLFGLLVISTVTLLAVASWTLMYFSLHEIQRQAEETRAVVLENRAALSRLLCSVSLAEHVQLEGLRRLSAQFGVELGAIPGESEVCSVPGDDVFIGSDHADEFRGTSGKDLMRGFGGGDELRGRGGGDALFGDDGNDVIWADGGADHEFGGDGNDRLNARADDHEVDVLDGGPGRDVCTLRPNDEARDCERIYRL